MRLVHVVWYSSVGNDELFKISHCDHHVGPNSTTLKRGRQVTTLPTPIHHYCSKHIDFFTELYFPICKYR